METLQSLRTNPDIQPKFNIQAPLHLRNVFPMPTCLPAHSSLNIPLGLCQVVKGNLDCNGPRRDVIHPWNCLWNITRIDQDAVAFCTVNAELAKNLATGPTLDSVEADGRTDAWFLKVTHGIIQPLQWSYHMKRA